MIHIENEIIIPNQTARLIIAILKVAGSSSSFFLIQFSVSSFFLFIIHIQLYIETNNPIWLTAYGTVLVVFSLIVGLGHSILPYLNHDLIPPAKQQHGGWSYRPKTGGLFSDVISEETAHRVNANYYKRISRKYILVAISYVLAIIGAIISGYAGLLESG